MSEPEEKRLFFAYEVQAPWPSELPTGRILPANCRHMTLAFQGKTDFNKLQALLPSFPKPPLRVGRTGHFDKCLNLAHVMAWHGVLDEDDLPLKQYHQTVIAWLQGHEFNPDKRHPWLPHVTLARKPFDAKQWQKSFSKLPFLIQHIHLYESLPNLNYVPRWTLPLTRPFEEIEHTADIAYNIYGESLGQLFWHAFAALCHRFPPLLEFRPVRVDCQNLDDVVIALNECISKADSVIGCPFKAISFHGDIQEKNGILVWEMIVDV